MKTTSFQEHIQDMHGRVDSSQGVIRKVKVLGPRSRNGREYTRQAMEQAAALYEGVRVNLDHPDHHQVSRQRSLAQQLGVLRNVKLQADGVYGDLFLLTSHPLAGMVMEAAAKMPNTFGLSHHAEGKLRTSGDKTVVESILGVHSVDLVQQPATVAGLFEGASDPPDRAEIVAQLKQRIAELEGQVEAGRADSSLTQHCHSMLHASQCPATLQRIDALKECDSDTQRQQLIESWQSSLPPRPVTSPGSRQTQASYAERTRHGIAAALGR